MRIIDRITSSIFGKAVRTAAEASSRVPPAPVTGYASGGFTTTTASGRTVLTAAPEFQNLPARNPPPLQGRRAQVVADVTAVPRAHSTNAQRQQLKRLVDDIRTVPGSRAPSGLNRQQRRTLQALQRKAGVL